jgi:hypothetical protein
MMPEKRLSLTNGPLKSNDNAASGFRLPGYVATIVERT